MFNKILIPGMAAILMLGFAGATSYASDGGQDQHPPRPCPGDHCDDDHGQKPPQDCPTCKPETKETCFNVVCSYSNPNAPVGYQNCRASATFNKIVTIGGGEVSDDSTQANNPALEVSCDVSSYPLFKNSARRFTDMLGTRIQGEQGPFPSISLPRGALHSGANGTSGDHFAVSVLELDAGGTLVREPGTCHIWTGIP